MSTQVYALRIRKSTSPQYKPGMYLCYVWHEVDIGPPGSHYTFEPVLYAGEATFFDTMDDAERTFRECLFRPGGIEVQCVTFVATD